MIRVLLVDDDESLRQLLAYKLKQDFGAVVDEVESGNEAIEMIKQAKAYCLIISDFNMPNGNGKELQDFLVENKVKSFFFFYTSENEIPVNLDHPEYLGLIQKPHIDILFEKLVEAVCLNAAKKLKTIQV